MRWISGRGYQDRGEQVDDEVMMILGDKLEDAMNIADGN